MPLKGSEVTLTLPDWFANIGEVLGFNNKSPEQESVYAWFKRTIKNHDEWEQNDFHLVHPESRRSFWIGNGGWFFQVERGTSHRFNIYEKWMSWFRYKANGSKIKVKGW